MSDAGSAGASGAAGFASETSGSRRSFLPRLPLTQASTITRISSTAAAPPAMYTYSMGTRRVSPPSSVKTAPLKRWRVSLAES